MSLAFKNLDMKYKRHPCTFSIYSCTKNHFMLNSYHHYNQTLYINIDKMKGVKSNVRLLMDSIRIINTTEVDRKRCLVRNIQTISKRTSSSVEHHSLCYNDVDTFIKHSERDAVYRVELWRYHVVIPKHSNEPRIYVARVSKIIRYQRFLEKRTRPRGIFHEIYRPRDVCRPCAAIEPVLTSNFCAIMRYLRNPAAP